MSSEIIGTVQYSQPRAEKVRGPGNMDDIHSAVHGTIAIHTDTQEQAQLILDIWSSLMEELSEKVQEHFWAMNPKEPVDPGDTYTGPTFRESDD